MTVLDSHLKRRVVVFNKLLRDHNVADLPQAPLEVPPLHPVATMQNVIDQHDVLKKRVWSDILRTADLDALWGAAESLKKREVKRENKVALETQKVAQRIRKTFTLSVTEDFEEAKLTVAKYVNPKRQSLYECDDFQPNLPKASMELVTVEYPKQGTLDREMLMCILSAREACLAKSFTPKT